MSIDHPTDATKLYKKLPDLVPQKVNLNGSSKRYLIDDYCNVMTALRNLDAAMGKANPHGRDYQTHSNPDASIEARRAWGFRRVLIGEMLKEIEHCAMMVDQQ